MSALDLASCSLGCTAVPGPELGTRLGFLDSITDEIVPLSGWVIAGSGKHKTVYETLTSPKGVASMIGLCNPSPPQANSDSGTGSSNSNRFAPLQEEGDSDATTDIVPTEGIADATNKALSQHKQIPTWLQAMFKNNLPSQKLKEAVFLKKKIRNQMELFRQTRRIFTRPNQSEIFLWFEGQLFT